MEPSTPNAQGWFDPAAAFNSVTTDVVYDRDGKQFGNLRIVQSANVMGWQTVLIPIVCIRNGDGPSLLLLGGTHGDEPEGPVVLLKLARKLQADDIRGRVIIIPALNYPAVEACQRGAPVDGRDLNRNFPGRLDGTLAEVIAHYVSSVLLTTCSVVLDLHAGGRDTRFMPSLWLLEGSDEPLWQHTLELARAFGAPFTMVSASLGGDMSESAAKRGCVYISTEAGGAATVDHEVVDLTEAGICRVMAHIGMIPSDRAPPCREPTRIFRVPGSRGLVLAEDHGLFEPVVSLGEGLKEGQMIGRIHRIERPDVAALEVASPVDGMVYGLRWSSHVRRGVRLATFAIPN